MSGHGDMLVQAFERSLMQHRCFGCGGVLTVFHLCPCCGQLVHPGCECASRWVRLGAGSVGVEPVPGEFQQEEGRPWQ